MKVVIIGGAGFIGTRLCKRLESARVDFIVLDKVKSDKFPEFSIVCNIEDLECLRSSFPQGVDAVINLAAEHKDNVQPLSRYHDVNVLGQRNVCEVMVHFGVKRHIFTSSVAVYGFVETETFEDGAFAPFHEYGQSKLDAERVLDSWFIDGEAVQHSVVRPTVVFGEGNRGNVYNLLKQIASGRFLMIGKGVNKKSMAYVENVAAFLEYLLVHGKGHQVFNYADKPDFDMNTLYRAVNESLQRQPASLRLPYWLGLCAGYVFDFLAKVTGREFPVSSIRVKKFCGTTQFGSRSIASSGFEPPVSLSEGLSNTVRTEFGSD